MADYKVVMVTTKKQLNELYGNSAITVEGLCEETIPKWLLWLRERGISTEGVEVWITKGKVMNENYGLTDYNAYPDDLTIVSLLNIDLSKLVVMRFGFGGRWFDDIVDNNDRRQKEINRR